MSVSACVCVCVTDILQSVCGGWGGERGGQKRAAVEERRRKRHPVQGGGTDQSLTQCPISRIVCDRLVLGVSSVPCRVAEGVEWGVGVGDRNRTVVVVVV